MYWFILRSI